MPESPPLGMPDHQAAQSAKIPRQKEGPRLTIQMGLVMPKQKLKRERNPTLGSQPPGITDHQAGQSPKILHQEEGPRSTIQRLPVVPKQKLKRERNPTLG
jgi:hypothetical protein